MERQLMKGLKTRRREGQVQTAVVALLEEASAKERRLREGML